MSISLFDVLFLKKVISFFFSKFATMIPQPQTARSTTYVYPHNYFLRISKCSCVLSFTTDPQKNPVCRQDFTQYGWFFFNSVECVQFLLFSPPVLGFIISFLRLLPKFFPRLFLECKINTFAKRHFNLLEDNVTRRQIASSKKSLISVEKSWVLSLPHARGVMSLLHPWG